MLLLVFIMNMIISTKGVNDFEINTFVHMIDYLPHAFLTNGHLLKLLHISKLLLLYWRTTSSETDMQYFMICSVWYS